jgi:hypothetical protein
MSELEALAAVAEAGGPWRDDLEVVERDADPDRLAKIRDELGLGDEERPPDA